MHRTARTRSDAGSRRRAPRLPHSHARPLNSASPVRSALVPSRMASSRPIIGEVLSHGTDGSAPPTTIIPNARVDEFLFTMESVVYGHVSNNILSACSYIESPSLA